MPKQRFDYVELNVRKTDEGFVIDSPVVARTGILEYRNDDGSIRRELRLPEDVFHADSLNSFKGKPITVDHPKGLVTHKDVNQFQIGTMLSAGRADGDNVKTDVVIHQPDKIGERRQLSLGYNVDLDETPGEWNGQRYDAIQRNIRVNHLSVVKSARAGAQARLNLDSNEEPLINSELVEMPKIRLDNGIEYEAAPEVIVALDKLRTDGAAQAAELNTVKTQVNSLTGERDTLKARVDGFPAELKAATDKAVDTAKASLQARTDLETVAKTFKVDAKDKTDAEVMHAVIKTFNPKFDAADKSAEYVKAAFDIAVSSRTDSNMQEQRKTVNGAGDENRNDAADTDYRTAYRRSLGSNGIRATDKE